MYDYSHVNSDCKTNYYYNNGGIIKRGDIKHKKKKMLSVNGRGEGSGMRTQEGKKNPTIGGPFFEGRLGLFRKWTTGGGSGREVQVLSRQPKKVNQP